MRPAPLLNRLARHDDSNRAVLDAHLLLRPYRFQLLAYRFLRVRDDAHRAPRICTATALQAKPFVGQCLLLPARPLRQLAHTTCQDYKLRIWILFAILAFIAFCFLRCSALLTVVPPNQNSFRRALHYLNAFKPFALFVYHVL